jgi:hypothetical protein
MIPATVRPSVISPHPLLAQGETDPFEKGDGDLADLDREIGGHMPADQEEDRYRPVGDHHRVGEPPGLAQVDQKVDNSEKIAQEAVQEGEPLDRLEIVAAEDLHRRPEHETRRGERHHGEEAESQEKTPRIVIGAVGDRGQADR